MDKNQYALTLESDAFNAFKSDFKQILNSTLNTMLQKEVDSADISMKIEINLEDGYAPDLEITTYAAEREITAPKFKHKITSTMKVKSEKSGMLGGDGYELVWDKEVNAFVMRSVKNAQCNLFDDSDEGDEPSAPRMLPPAQDIVDADYYVEADDELPGDKADDDDGSYEYDEPGDESDAD